MQNQGFRDLDQAFRPDIHQKELYDVDTIPNTVLPHSLKRRRYRIHRHLQLLALAG